MNSLFLTNSTLLGVGLAMDAFSVSLANGLNDPDMRKKKMCGVAGIFALFQGLMPMIGWICVHTIIQYFKIFEKMVPWIALFLLLFIGSNMMMDGIRNKNKETRAEKIGVVALVIQGVATSIDALSIGFTIAEYDFMLAFICATIISVVTFVICMAGVEIGKRFGIKLSNCATIFGGLILIIIGVEIFITGVFVYN